MSIELVRAYTNYRTKNAKVKARQSRERVEELKPDLALIGKAVVEAQGKGLTITEISQIIGLKNRNFIYDAKRAYQGVPNLPATDDEPDQSTSEPAEDEDSIQESWVSVGQDTYTVTIDGEDYEVWYDDANLFISDSLLDLSLVSNEYKKVVQRVIAEIEAAHETA